LKIVLDEIFWPWKKREAKRKGIDCNNLGKAAGGIFLSGVIIHPLIEECVFRLPVLLLFLGDGVNLISFQIVCILALIFSLVHISNGGVYKLVSVNINLFLGGLIYGFLALKTNNILWPILLHMIYNGYSHSQRKKLKKRVSD